MTSKTKRDPGQVHWNSFVHQPDLQLKPWNPKHWLENVTLRLIEVYLHWYFDTNLNIVMYRSGFLAILEDLLVRELFPHDLRRNMTMLVCTTLTDEYELDLRANTQPSVIDDLLYTLRKAISLTSSSARPGTLVEASGYIRSNNELKWEDVNPEDPTCQVLLMRVKHRLNKGKRNKGVPPVFTHTERNDNLGICIIRDIRTRIS
ncbi:hypothetical protein V8E54_010296 [Elaphomyces granulatus]